jgi:hypothetical protein
MTEHSEEAAAAAAAERALSSGQVKQSEEDAAAAAIQRALSSGQVKPSKELPERYQFIPEKALILDRELKEKYAKWLRLLLSAQLVIADAVFITYAWAGRNWKLDGAVIEIWLAATVVQVVGVVLVVTRHLFPQRDKG